MSQIQVRNEAAVSIARDDLLSINERNHCFRAWDTIGGQTFTGSPLVINLDTVLINTSADLFSLAASEVTVKQTGLYQVSYNVTFQHASGSSAAVAFAWLEMEYGAGFYERDGTRVFVPLHGAGSGSGACQTFLRMTANWRLRLRCQREWGSDTLTLPMRTCALSVLCLMLLR